MISKYNRNRLVATLGTAALLGTMLVSQAHAAVAYDTVFSATDAKDTASQIITDNKTFVLYGLGSAAGLMIVLAWFKRITKSVAKGRVK